MNNNSEKTIDIEYQSVEEEVYLTAPQVAQKIKDTDIRVRHWADSDVFGDLIGIEKVNGRKRYKESDIYKFAFIKDLLDNKNFSHDQAKVYIAKHGFKYANYDSGLVDPKDPLGFMALASALSVEVNKQLSEFKEDLINQVDNRIKSYIMIQGEAINNVLTDTVLKVDEVVSEKMEENLTNIKNHIDEKQEVSLKIQEENKQILEQVNTTMCDMKKENDEIKELIRNMIQSQRKVDEKKGGFWDKLTGKFK